MHREHVVVELEAPGRRRRGGRAARRGTRTRRRPATPRSPRRPSQRTSWNLARARGRARGSGARACRRAARTTRTTTSSRRVGAEREARGRRALAVEEGDLPASPAPRAARSRRRWARPSAARGKRPRAASAASARGSRRRQLHASQLRSSRADGGHRFAALHTSPGARPDLEVQMAAGGVARAADRADLLRPSPPAYAASQRRAAEHVRVHRCRRRCPARRRRRSCRPGGSIADPLDPPAASGEDRRAARGEQVLALVAAPGAEPVAVGVRDVEREAVVARRRSPARGRRRRLRRRARRLGAPAPPPRGRRDPAADRRSRSQAPAASSTGRAASRRCARARRPSSGAEIRRRRRAVPPCATRREAHPALRSRVAARPERGFSAP